MTDKKFRLPTEAEWEFAARGGNKTKSYKYSGSNNIEEVAWYSTNSDKLTHPIKTKKANELGLFDMCGNVNEWCQDWFGSYKATKSKTSVVLFGIGASIFKNSIKNPTGPSSGSYRVNRGGGWSNDPWYCRSSSRSSYSPDYRRSFLGLRLALSEF